MTVLLIKETQFEGSGCECLSVLEPVPGVDVKAVQHLGHGVAIGG